MLRQTQRQYTLDYTCVKYLASYKFERFLDCLIGYCISVKTFKIFLVKFL